MYDTALNGQRRERTLQELNDVEALDVLVIGGGITGAGIALDAASRGLRTGIVEAQDWSAGTSGQSSGLVHGGLRYLYALDFTLVAEALRERGLLLRTIAPHLVTTQPFLWPLRTPAIERAYSAVGIGLYDALSVASTRGLSVPLQRHYTRSSAKKLFPSLKDDSIVGALRFYDARVDDARLVISLVRTAVGHGALAASRTTVTDLLKDGSGRVTGARVNDLEKGSSFNISARQVINATGVWTEETQSLADSEAGLEVLASKGVHILVPRDRIKGEAGLFLRTEKSVLFIIPWDRHWLIGTTDTPWKENLQHPVATSADIDYILDHANEALDPPLSRSDIVGTTAGLRPLLRPKAKTDESVKVSREHTVASPAAGLSVIAGGKLTTYRVMAKDAVDFALGKNQTKMMPSITQSLPLVGAARYEAMLRQRETIASRYGWTVERVDHLLQRYGSEIGALLQSIDSNSEFGNPLKEAPAYLRAEVAFAVTHEGALHVEDILRQRIRLDREAPDRGLSALSEITEIVAPLLGWDKQHAGQEVNMYHNRVNAIIEAQYQTTDSEAMKVRLAGIEAPAPEVSHG